MTRDELNDKARAAGITDPESYPNMESLEAALDDREGAGTNPAPGTDAPAPNDTIEHTRGGVTTRSDASDLGVPMAPVDDPETYSHPGPEDAYDPNARGDYSGRLTAGPHVVMDPVPAADRQADEVTETVEQPDGSEVDVTVREPKPNVAPREVTPGV